jgi:hypothetical protein
VHLLDQALELKILPGGLFSMASEPRPKSLRGYIPLKVAELRCSVHTTARAQMINGPN